MSRRYYVMLAVLCFVSPVAVCVGWRMYVERQVFSLLRGNADIHLESFRIEGQQVRLTCSNNEIVQLLENSLRSADWCGPDYRDGFSYSLTLYLDSGDPYQIPTYISNDTIYLSIPKLALPQWGVELGSVTHRLQFKSSGSEAEEMHQILEFLAAPYDAELDTYPLPKSVEGGKTGPYLP